MNYGIKIEYKYPHQKLMKGIYKITFGDVFYIGQAKRLCERMYQHERGIYGCLRRYTMPRRYEKSYLKIAKYLHEHPKIQIGYVEIIQRCVTDWDLYYAERNWLYDYKDHPDCLNSVFEVSKSYIKGDEWDTEIKDRIVWCFDPRDPATRVHQFWPLRKNGELRSERSVRKEFADILQLQSDPPLTDTTL